MSDVTFAGLKAKLKHSALREYYEAKTLTGGVRPFIHEACAPDCPRCYAERLEKRVEELREGFVERGDPITGEDLTALLGSDGKVEK